MTLLEIQNVLNDMGFRITRDYDLKEDQISLLVIDKDYIFLLRSVLSDEWLIVEKGKNLNDTRLRIDIVRK